MLRNLLQNWMTGGTKPTPRASQRVRPRFETLEDRSLPSASPFSGALVETINPPRNDGPALVNQPVAVNVQASAPKPQIIWTDLSASTPTPPATAKVEQSPTAGAASAYQWAALNGLWGSIKLTSSAYKTSWLCQYFGKNSAYGLDANNWAWKTRTPAPFTGSAAYQWNMAWSYLQSARCCITKAFADFTRGTYNPSLRGNLQVFQARLNHAKISVDVAISSYWTLRNSL